jgi:hypothetical protein
MQQPHQFLFVFILQLLLSWSDATFVLLFSPAQLPAGERNVSGTGSQVWTYLTGDGVHDAVPDNAISINGVDHRLLDRAREEVPAGLDKILRKLSGKCKRDTSKILPSDFLKAFMDPPLLGYMKTFINSNISCSNHVSSSEIMASVCVKMMLSFYKVRYVIASLKYLFVILQICSLFFL